MDAQTKAKLEQMYTQSTHSYDVKEIINYPPIGLSPASMSPLEKLYVGAMLMMVRPRIIVELGVFRGVTTEYLCAFIKANNIESRVYGFDLPPIIDELRQNNPEIRVLEEEGVLVLVPGALPDSLTDWLSTHDAPIDFAVVDALHDYKSVTSELEILWPRLHPHGLIICHDYDDNPLHHGVRLAVDRFVKRTRDAQGAPLVSPETRYETLLAGDGDNNIENFIHFSTLALLRKRIYKPSTLQLGQFLWEEARWQWQRGEHPVRKVLHKLKRLISR